MLVAVTLSLLLSAWAGEKKDSACMKPPELLSEPKPSKEEQEKARKLRAQGSIAISIGEDGNVSEAKVVRASSPEAGDLLLTRAKAMKFKTRPGCGSFKTIVNYTLGQ